MAASGCCGRCAVATGVGLHVVRLLRFLVCWRAAVASNTTVSDPACGHKLGNASWGVSVAGIIVTVITIIILVAVFVTAASQAAASVATSSSAARAF